ncbi:hypothetical protein ASE04_28155 [Rhizobium sp. Root708]|uniref:hypothetical protein n=1 Tax=Rhizobium sp. Root708 TaxID=1736592 RepID=UPI000712D5B5|nr:hypothetical protein [Rhizobium sp. Root708]KRB58259.1 hypothetical protein ASE04_28155 [Rhizobium sp. Root708]
MNERQSITHAERRQRFDQTHQIATATIDAQRAAREAKTARLRALRLASETEAANERAVEEIHQR